LFKGKKADVPWWVHPLFKIYLMERKLLSNLFQTLQTNEDEESSNYTDSSQYAPDNCQ
jgi:hypothetical protein